MSKITPLASVPVTGPDHVAVASKFIASPSEFVWVAGRVTAGSVKLRPYYWEPEDTSLSGIGGAWIPLGGDAVQGTSPVAFDVTKYGGCANGRFVNRRSQAIYILVEEDAVGRTYDFIHLSAELSTTGQ